MLAFIPDGVKMIVVGFLAHPDCLHAAVAFRLGVATRSRITARAQAAATKVTRFIAACYANAPWRTPNPIHAGRGGHQYGRYRRFLRSTVGVRFMRKRLVRYVLQKYRLCAPEWAPSVLIELYGRKYVAPDRQVQGIRNALKAVAKPSRYDVARFVHTMSRDEIFDAGI